MVKYPIDYPGAQLEAEPQSAFSCCTVPIILGFLCLTVGLKLQSMSQPAIQFPVFIGVPFQLTQKEMIEINFLSIRCSLFKEMGNLWLHLRW